MSASEAALNIGCPLRILITAQTYTAVDNLLLGLEEKLREKLGISLIRVQGSKRPISNELAGHPALQNILLNVRAPNPETLALREKLTDLGVAGVAPEVVIVGMPSQQVHNLAVAFPPDPIMGRQKSVAAGDTRKPWFDLIVIDEATQLDVASSTLIFGKAAVGASCVLAGDHLQLPPIHQADPPKDLDDLVGSAYAFMHDLHGIDHKPLLISRRSNEQIVDFIKRADYPTALKSHSPKLSLNVLKPLPTTKPMGWPTSLEFSDTWARLLDPGLTVVCIVHEDDSSGQTNEFEAQSVAALIRTLHDNIGEPINRLDRHGKPLQASTASYNMDKFWEDAVGVVAPHRAQGSKIVDKLANAFAGTGTKRAQIRAAVDTVERYQGQERDVIIASYGLGDPDAIASEEEFLFDLNRFNVLVSRAAVKVIVFVTRSLLDHLANDQDILRNSRLIKDYAESYCDKEFTLALPFQDSTGSVSKKTVIVRHR